MPAAITRLVPKPERLRQDQAENLRQAIGAAQAQLELPLDLVREIYQHIEKRTASKSRWTFVMLSPEQNSIVVDYIIANSKLPMIAVRLWALCFKHLRTDTGEILLKRDEIAEKIGNSPEDISRIMTELEKCGAIIRRREKQRGMKGRGIVLYFMNPNVATHLAGAERDNAQAAAPPLLTLMQGGKPVA